MAEKKKPEPDNPEQSKRFLDTARDLIPKGSSDAFARAMVAVVPTKPAKKTAKK